MATANDADGADDECKGKGGHDDKHSNGDGIAEEVGDGNENELDVDNTQDGDDNGGHDPVEVSSGRLTRF